MKTILLIGLGNPGKVYEKTRHNAGFMFLDFFWDEYRDGMGPPTNSIDRRVNFSDWEFSKKINGDISISKTNDKKIILLKPQVFMNLSGEAVASAMKYYKIPCRGETSANLFVAHDEIDLPLGSYRFSANSSSAGHHGVQNIIDAIGTKNFTRLRIGVDSRAGKKIATEKYVLGKFTDTEIENLMKTLELAAGELRKKI